MSVNRVILLGNLGRDPELRHTQGGQAVCTLSVATSERWTDKQGERQERTEWHRVIVWGRQAELCAEYLRKGRQVYVEGRIQSEEWTDKEGNQRQTKQVVAQQVVFIGRGEGGSSGGYSGGGGGSSSGGYGDDDIPF